MSCKLLKTDEQCLADWPLCADDDDDDELEELDDELEELDRAWVVTSSCPDPGTVVVWSDENSSFRAASSARCRVVAPRIGRLRLDSGE